MNDASNIPENEQPEGIPAASDAAQEADANTSAQAQTPADDNAAAARTCPQCGAALKPGASFCANCGAPVDGSDDVTYHIVRPETERSYADANFQPSDDAANTPPRYYTPAHGRKSPNASAAPAGPGPRAHPNRSVSSRASRACASCVHCWAGSAAAQSQGSSTAPAGPAAAPPPTPAARS